MAENVSLTLKSHTWGLTLKEASIDQIAKEFPYTFPIEFNRAPTALTLKPHPYTLTLKPHTWELSLNIGR